MYVRDGLREERRGEGWRSAAYLVHVPIAKDSGSLLYASVRLLMDG